MYKPILTQSGVEAAATWLGEFGITSGPDGLVLAPGSTFSNANLLMPAHLEAFLLDLRLLRRVPLSYLVPDARLLPAESIRFFHVDQTWVDRLVDGVFSVASVGTVDFALHCTILAMSRKKLDDVLAADAKAQVQGSSWTPAQGMTGMLIRSELARRWPDMVIKAFAGSERDSPEVPVLRAENISRDIYIALFAGQPARVEIREPFAGLRYGVESKNPDSSGPPYKVDPRDSSGGVITHPPGDESADAEPVDVLLHDNELRTLKLKELSEAGTINGAPRMIALHLEQRPYSQVFTMHRDEAFGSEVLPLDAEGNVKPIALRSGRSMRLTSLAAQHQVHLQLQEGGE